MRFPLPDRHPRDSYEHMLMQMHMAVFTDTLFIKKRERKACCKEHVEFSTAVQKFYQLGFIL